MLRIQYVLGAALAVAALGVLTSPANAQQGYRGTFQLPFQTYWGGSVLEPGEYTVTFGGQTETPGVIHVQGANGSAAILGGPAELNAGVGKGRLVLENVNGIYAIREFDAGAAGKSFTFRAPKSIGDVADHRGGSGVTTVVSMH